jgi:NAD(P)-dependent dehydrogenase (short-subunit alcohol dehydrogenase family)
VGGVGLTTIAGEGFPCQKVSVSREASTDANPSLSRDRARGLENASVLITGGTRGLGKAVGMEFSRVGAKVYLTHRWGSVNEQDLITEFCANGLPAPTIFESDASDLEATRSLMGAIKAETDTLDILVSNVAFAKVVHELGDLKRSALELSLRYSAWPVVDQVQAAYETFGRYPRYVIGVSSNGGEVCFDGYDLVGASKAVLETLCRYLAFRLRPQGVRVNVIRPGLLDTDSSRAVFSDDVIEAIEERNGSYLLDAKGVAKVCVALCSGWMDAVTGQVIVVDEGWSLVSPIAFTTGHGLPGPFPIDKAGGA